MWSNHSLLEANEEGIFGIGFIELSANMAFCYCSNSQLSCKIENLKIISGSQNKIRGHDRSSFALKGPSTSLFGKRFTTVGFKLNSDWSFAGGSRVIRRPELPKFAMHPKGLKVQASWWTSSQIASNWFTLGTAAVLPFYTLMVMAPKAELTRKTMESNIPYIALGILYAYLLYLSWTPDTIKLMFASKYWLPELPGIAKMFSSELTLSSAWIHLLAVDLFAARQVFQDGLENKIETRHSVSLCLLFCPIGIVTHFMTKALLKNNKSSRHGL